MRLQILEMWMNLVIHTKRRGKKTRFQLLLRQLLANIGSALTGIIQDPVPPL